MDREVLPALMTSLEPILPVLLAQQSNNLDLGQIINYVTQTVQKSTFHVGMSSHLGNFDFLDIGKLNNATKHLRTISRAQGYLMREKKNLRCHPLPPLIDPNLVKIS